MEILNMEQLKTVLTHLENVELQAIQIMGTIRDPRYIYRDTRTVVNTLIEIQIKIREFRCSLSKNSGEFSFPNYDEFVVFAATALIQCGENASTPIGYQTV